MVTVAESDAEERALIARIAINDRTAFETFYHAYVRRAYAFAFTLTGAVDLAEEIAGDTMIEVWRSARRYAGRARVATWVFAIVHHRAVGTLRRKRVNVVPLDLAPVAAVWDEPAGDRRLGDGSDTLTAALATLSPQHRAVLELTYTFDCTQAEIAAIVNVPLPTVKSRMFHAKRNLRAALERNATGGAAS